MISIGLCMIVKNEEAVLRRILTPMSKLVDKIYICDTGSVDKTKEIAREFTDEVYDFLWSDDFSAGKSGEAAQVERKHGFRYGCGYDGLCSGI